MKSANKITGNKGEDLTVEYLKEKGYLVIERNFRTRFGEIDIVCLDGQILVFVEVKTKIGHKFGEPEDMVSKGKLAQVRRMGEVFIEMNKMSVASDSDHPIFRLGVASVSPRRLQTAGSRRIPASKLDTPVSDAQSLNSSGWNGRCRVDVVGIVLKDSEEVETIRHHEAVY